MKKIHAIVLMLAAAVMLAPAARCANPLDALKGVIGAVVGGSGTATTIPAGTWKYNGPAVTFKGDNALKNLSGAAAGTVLESKLKTYYEKAGLQNMELTVGEDSTFVMKLKKVSLKGHITYGESGQCTLNLDGIGKLVGGKFNGQWQVIGNTMTLTFDISKLVDLVTKISAATSKSSLKSISKMLESYDGAYAGFRLDKL
ncbi:MAG: DUF4923 family protein [Muribaculaceae bacterium]|nr:DUF4923 family protein [Muribaculaceae bacterium]